MQLHPFVFFYIMADPRIELLKKEIHELQQLLKLHNISISSSASSSPTKHEDRSLDYKREGYALITTHAPRNIDWDSYLPNIGSLFVEPHISDLEDTFEGLTLLFDDSHCIFAVTPSSSLEFALYQFLHSSTLSLSCLFGYMPEWSVASSSFVDKETHEQFSEASSFFMLPSFRAYPEWEASLHLYMILFLPKVRQVVSMHQRMFFLQTLIILVGDYSLWGAK